MNKLNLFYNNISKIFKPHNNVRYYSRYPPRFVEPVVNVEQLENILKTTEPIEIKMLGVKAAKHHITCSVFYDPDLHLLSQRLMRNGNRTLAKRLVNSTLETIKRMQLEKYYSSSEEGRENIELDPKVIFHRALENTTPILGTKLVQRSGTFYNIPTMVTPERAKFLAMKFLIEAASEKGNKDKFHECLAIELIKASENKGKAVQKKVDLHKYCEANRTYAHYRWT